VTAGTEPERPFHRNRSRRSWWRSPLLLAGDDPNRWLVIGPDRAGNLLEVIVLITVEGDEIVIHAMPRRPKYRRLLEP
jgi:hypothetical protein